MSPAKPTRSGGERGALAVLRSALRVARKELHEGFRDRQTLLYTFVLPVCMYPAMFWIMVQGVLVVQGQKQARDVVVGIAAHPDLPLEVAEDARAALAGEDDSRISVELLGVDQAAAIAANPEAAARDLIGGDGDATPDAVVALPATLDGEGEVRVLFDSTNSDSTTARDRMEAAVGAWADALRTERARAADPPVDPEALDPFTIDSRSVAEKSDEGALLLSLMLPILLVVMSVIGAFFPAVDLTAGEKERNTAETTMLLPVPRTGVHLGKILAVCASGMIATALNLFAIALSAEHLLAQLTAASSDSISIQLPIGALLSVLPFAVLFAFFVSAALTGVASLAASFKEGQALLGPVQMLFIFPAMAASLPGLELNAVTGLIPVVNVGLAFRALLIGEASAVGLTACALSLVVFALVAIWFAVRLRSSEAVALAGETVSLKRLLALMRSPRH